jgi:hypothetical protein
MTAFDGRRNIDIELLCHRCRFAQMRGTARIGQARAMLASRLPLLDVLERLE